MEDIRPLAGNIIVSCNTSQKEEMKIGNNLLKTGKAYNENFRERNPVVAKVIGGSKEIPAGSYIICNYSHFDLESPFHIYGAYYSIPIDEEIFAIVNSDGSLTPVCGNVLVLRINKESLIDLPEELVKPKINEGIAASGEFKGKLIFWLPYANYTICYNWNGVDMEAIKIHESEITGYIKK